MLLILVFFPASNEKKISANIFLRFLRISNYVTRRTFIETEFALFLFLSQFPTLSGKIQPIKKKCSTGLSQAHSTSPVKHLEIFFRKKLSFPLDIRRQHLGILPKSLSKMFSKVHLTCSEEQLKEHYIFETSIYLLFIFF